VEIISQLGEFTQVKADAVVNAANSLEKWRRVAGALHRAGGPEMSRKL